MNATSVDIKDILEDDSSLDLVFGTNLFIAKEPANAADNCVTIFDTPGFAPQLTMAQGENYFYPSAQIRVRNKSYTVGWALIDSIRTLLHGKSHETWNSTDYQIIYCNSGPAFLQFDDHNRAVFVINFNIQRR